jgi:undecaprenyl-diphosphatase
LILGAVVFCAKVGLAQELSQAQRDLIAMSLDIEVDAAGTTGTVFDTDMKLPVDPPRRSFWLSYSNEHGPKKYLEWFWKDPVNLFSRPYFWGVGEWETFGIEAGITGALMPADREIREVVQRNRDEGLTHTLKVINDYYGSVDLVYGGAGLFVVGLIAQNEKVADTGFLAAESVFYATALSTATKNLFGRERPSHAKDQWQFHGPSRTQHSFVSGDAIVAFAFSSAVSEVWQKWWITWPLYGAAIGVAAARVDRNAHWTSDVVGAAFLGTAVGKSLVHFHYRRNADGVLVPFVGDREAGMQLSMRF